MKLVIRVLEHDPHSRKQLRRRDRLPRDGEPPFLRGVQAGKQAGERGLARAVVPDERGHARRNRHVHTVEQGRLSGVREPQARNGQPAFTRLQPFRRAVRRRAAGIVHTGGAQPAPLAQGVVIQQVKTAPFRNPAFLHDKHAIRYAFQPVQPMIHHKDRHAPRFQFSELAGQILGSFWIEVGARLIKDKGPRPL